MNNTAARYYVTIFRAQTQVANGAELDALVREGLERGIAKDQFNIRLVPGSSAASGDTKTSLLAAAPDLLDACRAVIAFLDGLKNNTKHSDPLCAIRRRVH